MFVFVGPSTFCAKMLICRRHWGLHHSEYWCRLVQLHKLRFRQSLLHDWRRCLVHQMCVASFWIDTFLLFHLEKGWLVNDNYWWWIVTDRPFEVVDVVAWFSKTDDWLTNVKPTGKVFGCHTRDVGATTCTCAACDTANYFYTADGGLTCTHCLITLKILL